VEEHAVEDAAFFPRGGRLADQLAAARGDGVEGLAAGADVERGIQGAAEQQGAGFEFVVERADEAAELADGVAELQLVEIPGGVAGVDPVGTPRDLREKTRGGVAEGEEMGQQSLADWWARIIEQTQKRLPLAVTQLIRLHAQNRKRFCV
jgi:hypothetical protein